MSSSDVTDSPKWVRLEIVCGTLSGIFREDSRGKHELVMVYAPLPCTTIELVDDSGSRESVGVIFSGELADIRRGAENLGREYGVPVVDCTLDPVGGRQ